MANLGGTGAQDDPIIIETLEDLKSLLEMSPLPTHVTVDGYMYTYIEFPNVNDGPKILDYRSRGWNPIQIKGIWNQDGNNISLDRYTVNINFNGWTILGMSIMDSWFLALGSGFYQGTPKVTFENMIVKNAYVLANTTDRTAFMGCCGAINLYTKNCKFSGVVDAQNKSACFFWNQIDGSTGQYIYLSTCSFNIDFTNRTDGVQSRFNRNAYSEGSVTNCILNIDSTRWNHDSSSNSTCYEYSSSFCKFTGTVNSYNQQFPRIIIGNNSVYNVIEVDMICHDNQNPWFYSNSNSGITILNESKIVAAQGYSVSWQDSGITHLTNSQMTDPDALRSVFFIVGDTPT